MKLDYITSRNKCTTLILTPSVIYILFLTLFNGSLSIQKGSYTDFLVRLCTLIFNVIAVSFRFSVKLSELLFQRDFFRLGEELIEPDYRNVLPKCARAFTELDGEPVLLSNFFHTSGA